MPLNPNQGRTPRDEATFKARLEARLAEAMRMHERALSAAERRIADAMRAHERGLEAAERSMDRAMRGAGQGMDRMELIRAIKGRRKPPGGPQRRDLEGGEGVPAVPRPRPNPLAGAAAAPIG
ncbi:MAG TPA: hypothetical protein VF548_08510 [Allosphingosinicella sp.]|jgi:hypothetical protein